MLLHEITLKNLLSFGPDTAPLVLKPLNVIIGPNGSGKSNFIEAIGLLQAASTDFGKPMRQSGGVQEWLWKGNPNAEAIAEISANASEFPNKKKETTHSSIFDKTRLSYTIEFTQTDGALSISREKITALNPGRPKGGRIPVLEWRRAGAPAISKKKETSNGGFSWGRFDPRKTILSQLRDPEGHPEVTNLGLALADIRIYRDWVFGRNSPLRTLQHSDLPFKWLEEDAANLGLILKRLTRDLKAKNKMLGFFHAIYEGAQDFDVDVVGGRVQVIVKEANFTVPSTRLSDGTLRYLCLMAILLHPEPPPLICIDEPELGLHPDLIGSLVEALNDASQRTQLIVTTHSDSLVDAFTNDPEAIIVCEKHNGSTQMERLDAEHLKPWLEDYRLGRLWSKGEIGGNRW